ncbi:MAG: hypothetical protein RBT36_05640 [Desulfobulbus sp.]|nr:hypothetical protein [Desulfobulbus sp.]
MNEDNFLGFGNFSDEDLLAALDAESYEAAPHLSGHMARELIYGTLE